MIFLTGIFKGTDTVIGRDGLWNIRINVNQYIAFVSDQKRCRLERTHIIVAGYATDMFSFALNGNDRDLVRSQFFGRKSVT